MSLVLGLIATGIVLAILLVLKIYYNRKLDNYADGEIVDSGEPTQGPSGRDGQDGLDAPFPVLESHLVGRNGKNGVDGVKGPQGVNGENGSTGPKGAVGPKGILGLSGGPGRPSAVIIPTVSITRNEFAIESTYMMTDYFFYNQVKYEFKCSAIFDDLCRIGFIGNNKNIKYEFPSIPVPAYSPGFNIPYNLSLKRISGGVRLVILVPQPLSSNYIPIYVSPPFPRDGVVFTIDAEINTSIESLKVRSEKVQKIILEPSFIVNNTEITVTPTDKNYIYRGITNALLKPSVVPSISGAKIYVVECSDNFSTRFDSGVVWGPSGTYVPGDIVNHLGLHYININPVGPSPNSPPIDVANWNPYTAESDLRSLADVNNTGLGNPLKWSFALKSYEHSLTQTENYTYEEPTDGLLTQPVNGFKKRSMYLNSKIFSLEDNLFLEKTITNPTNYWEKSGRFSGVSFPSTIINYVSI